RACRPPWWQKSSASCAPSGSSSGLAWRARTMTTCPARDRSLRSTVRNVASTSCVTRMKASHGWRGTSSLACRARTSSRSVHRGLPHDQVTVGVSGREAHGRVHDGLVFDGGQSAQAGLPAAAVIGPLDPGNDRDPELLSGPPALAVQDVLLEQRKEGLHRGVVASGTDLPHRSDEVVTVQSVHELPRPKLRPAVR